MVKRFDKLVLHALIEREGDRYSALCLELDVATEGATPDEALDNLREAVQGYLETVFANQLQDELFPRLAPPEEWRKFFKALKRRLEKDGFVENLLTVGADEIRPIFFL